MTSRKPYLVAHGAVLTTSAPDEVIAAIDRVVKDHEKDFDAALATYGLALSDISKPAWQIILRMGDIQEVRT